MRSRLTFLLLIGALFAVSGVDGLLHAHLHDHGADTRAIEQCQIQYLLTVAAGAMVWAVVLLAVLGESIRNRPARETQVVAPYQPIPLLAPRAPPSTAD